MRALLMSWWVIPLATGCRPDIDIFFRGTETDTEADTGGTP